MKVDVILTALGCTENDVRNKNAVIIDVLRATTVITVALSNGAKSVTPFKTIDEVMEYSNIDRRNKILGGERSAHKISNFDCGNSPSEYTSEVVKGKEIVLTTTNGTKAIENAKAANNLYIMGLVNLQAVAEKLMFENKDTVIVCAGTKGTFSTEDCVCAGECISYICDRVETELSDAAWFLREFYRMSNKDMKELTKESLHLKKLISSGYGNDIDFCLKESILNIAPYYKNGKIYI